MYARGGLARFIIFTTFEDFSVLEENRWRQICNPFFLWNFEHVLSVMAQFDRFERLTPSHALLISAVCSERFSFLRATREVVRRNADLRKVCRPRLRGKR